MTIRFHCDHCGRMVEAPDSAGGQRGKCPYCHNSNYVPAPPDQVEEIDLAPLDEEDEKRRQREVADLLEAERELRMESAPVEDSPRLTEHDPDEVKAADLHHLVVNYCLDMAAGNLERAETHVQKLRGYPSINREAVDDFLSGRTLEPTLDAIPVKVLQGFLKNLLGELR